MSGGSSAGNPKPAAATRSRARGRSDLAIRSRLPHWASRLVGELEPLQGRELREALEASEGVTELPRRKYQAGVTERGQEQRVRETPGVVQCKAEEEGPITPPPGLEQDAVQEEVSFSRSSRRRVASEAKTEVKTEADDPRPSSSSSSVIGRVEGQAASVGRRDGAARQGNAGARRQA